jgi:uncharacterized protein (TIGR03437 family)
MKPRLSLAFEILLLFVALALAAGPVAAQTLTATPSAVIFQYSNGQPSPEPVEVTIAAGTGETLNISATLAPKSGTPAGLFQVTISNSEVSIGVDRGTLSSITAQANLYTANVTVTASGFAPLTIPVTLNLGLGTLSFQATPTALVFNMLSGATSQAISLSATSSANVGFSVSATTNTGGNWLSVTADSEFTPATLTISVNPGTLAAATYTGTVTVSPSTGGMFAIPVTMQAGASTGLTVSPSSFSFLYAVGGAVPPAQQLHLTSNIGNNTFTARANSTGAWLLLNGVTGPVTGAFPEDLNVTISPATLGGGSYQGTITVNSPDGSAQVIPVSLTVNGGVSSVANPTSLAFVAQAGGAAPAQQMVVISGSTNTGFSAVVSSVGGWLSVSQTSGMTPAQISVTATPAGLAAGTYTGNMAITVGGRAQNIQATLTVSANPVLAANPGALVVYYMGGNPVPALSAVTVSVNAGPQQTFAVSTGQPSWLQAPGGAGLTTPSNLSISVNPTSLATGTYLANLVLTPSAQGGIPVTVPVLLVVTGAPAVVPTATALTFNAKAGGSPQSQTLPVTASTPAAFTAAATTTSGGSWLAAAPASGTATPVGIPLTVTADATHLAAGTYQGVITLTTSTGVTTQVPVSFSVGASEAISVTPATLTFNYAGGAAPEAQTVQVTGSQSFSATAHTNDGGKWLSVTPSSGSGNSSLSVKTDPTGLTAGTYGGSITVTPASGTAQTVAVTLTVTAVSSISVTPNTLAFTYRTGDNEPATQPLSVSGLGAVDFAAAASSSGWLSVTPTSGTAPATLTVSAYADQLGAGNYTGTITITAASGGALVTINVTCSVTAPLPAISRVVNAASYVGGSISPGEVVVIFGSSLGPSEGKSAGADSDGFFEPFLANVGVTFNGYPAPVLYAGAGQVNAVVPYALAGASNALVVLTFGKARSNSISLPVLSSAPGIFSADSSGTGPGAILDSSYRLVSASNPVSRGSYIQIYATGEGQTTPNGCDGKVAGITLPLPYPRLPVAVLIGNQPAKVTYVGAAPGLVAGALQINAQIPDGTPSGVVPVVVRIGDNSSQAGITVAVQ